MSIAKNKVFDDCIKLLEKRFHILKKDDIHNSFKLLEIPIDSQKIRDRQETIQSIYD